MSIPASPSSDRAYTSFIDAFLPNELDKLNSPTYHFRLFLTSEENVFSGTVGDPSEQIVLAESGVTGISIEDVTLLSLPSTSLELETSSELTAELKIVQPYGANFLDLIYFSCEELGISNYTKAVYFLELSFRAPSEEYSTDVLSNKWTWPLNILTMEIDVDASGSTYAISAAILHSVAKNTQNSDFKSTVTMGSEKRNIDGDTVGQLLHNMGQVFSFINETELGSRDVINIVVLDEELSKEKIIADKPQEHPSAQGSYLLEDRTFTTFNAGTSLEKAIGSVLLSTDYFQRLAKNTTARDSDEADKDDLFKTLFRIHPEVSYVGYDSELGDYIRKITFYVVPFKKSPLITSTNEADRYTRSPERVQQYVDSGLLRKRYDYIFTGMNDQIIDINLKFNFIWYASIPYRTAALNSYPFVATGKVLNQQKRVSRLQKLGAQIDELHAGILGPLILRPEQKRALAEQVENIREQLRGEQLSILETISLSNKLLDIEAVASSSSRAKPSNNIRYAEDINVSELTDEHGAFLSRMPLTFMPTNESQDYDFGVERHFAEGKTMISSTFTQSRSDESADMLTLDMEIKGDPYWINYTPSSSSQYITTEQEISLEQQYGTNSTISRGRLRENYLLFTSQTPDISSIIGENGETKKFTNNTVLNGIYGVYKVEHKFINGKFTQKLTCVRELLTDVNLSDILNLKRQSTETETTGSGVISRESIPTPSIPETSYGIGVPPIIESSNKPSDFVSEIKDAVTSNINTLSSGVVNDLSTRLKTEASAKINSIFRTT